MLVKNRKGYELTELTAYSVKSKKTRDSYLVHTEKQQFTKQLYNKS